LRIVYTVGHSNRGLEELINLLKRYGIRVIIDIRRFPTSRKYPHFNRENLSRSLEGVGIKYFWLGNELGGFREGGYEKYMASNEWLRGYEHLLKLLEEFKDTNIALMCSERLWFKCHRRFISDALVRDGFKVIHIIDAERVYVHKLRSP